MKNELPLSVRAERERAGMASGNLAYGKYDILKSMGKKMNIQYTVLRKLESETNKQTMVGSLYSTVC